MMGFKIWSKVWSKTSLMIYFLGPAGNPRRNHLGYNWRHLTTSEPSKAGNPRRDYLCVFSYSRKFLDFRRQEVESLAQLFSREEEVQIINGGGGSAGSALVEWRLPQKHHMNSPFHFVSLPSEDIARKTANRSVLVKGMYELWGEGTDYEQLERAIKQYPEDRKLPYLTEDSTFKIIVDSFRKVISSQERDERICRLSFIPFKGRNKVKQPDHKFWLMEITDSRSDNSLPHGLQKTLFFGRQVGAADKTVLQKYELKSRKHVGPTTLDPKIAFLMANQGHAGPDKMVYDPFVGTGSTLLAAAHFGAMTMYGLKKPLSLMRVDISLPLSQPDLKEKSFHAIICDPPYGIRVPRLKTGGQKGVPWVEYSQSECMHDLLDLSAKLLIIGGRLVFFYNVSKENKIEYPKHPCLKLIYVSDEQFSPRYGRYLITMVKIGEYTNEIEEQKRAKERYKV